MTLPVQKPARQWRWIVVLGLFLFAAGLLLGPPLHDETFALIDHVAPKLATRMPRLFGWLGPTTAVTPPGSRAAAPSPRPGAPVAVVPAPPPEPPPAPRRAAQIEAIQPTEAELAAAAAAVASAARAGHAGAARPQRGRAAARPAPAPKAPLLAEASGKKPAKERDPFDTGSDGAGGPAAARRSKAAAEEPTLPKSEPAPKAARGSDALDNLMADVMTETKGKGKKRDSKGLDAMLKDVQKSEPAPVAKREEPAALEPLSPSDISRAMATVKTKAVDCAQRLGQSGVAELKVTVGKQGRVTDVRVGGKLAGSPLGACIDKAVRATTFRPNAGLTFDYRIDAR
jgi:hypothetical protein